MCQKDIDIRKKYDYYTLAGLYRRAISLGDFQLAKYLGETLKLIEKN